MKQSAHKIYNKIYQEQATNYKNYLHILGYKIDTCQTRYLYLKQFFSWLESSQIIQLEAITPKNITDYQNHLKNCKSLITNEKLGNETIYERLRLVQNYFGYILDYKVKQCK